MESEYTTEELEVLTALKDVAKGLTAHDLFNKTETVSDHMDLARHTRRLIQLGMIYKKDNRYYRVDLEEEAADTEEEEEQETRSSAPVVLDADEDDDEGSVVSQVVVRKAVETATSKAVATALVKAAPKKDPKRPSGELRRHGAIGRVAMTLWMYRNEGYALPISRLHDCVGQDRCTASAVYQALGTLTKMDMIVRVGTGMYRWGTKFAYPFSAPDIDDAEMVKVLPKSMRTTTSTPPGVMQVAAPAPSRVADPAPVLTTAQAPAAADSKSNEDEQVAALAAIDAAILLFESQLTGLRTARMLLVAA